MKRVMIYLLRLFVRACTISPGRGVATAPFGSPLAESEKLGDQISDLAVRKKVMDLYARRDVVVEQVVIR